MLNARTHCGRLSRAILMGDRGLEPVRYSPGETAVSPQGGAQCGAVDAENSPLDPHPAWSKFATTKKRGACSCHYARWVWRLIGIGVLARKSREWDNHLTVALAARVSRARIGRGYLIS